MMDSTERFVALLVGIIAIIAGIGGMLRLLAVISWKLGQIVADFNSHVADDDKIHTDIETRMRAVERPARRR